MVDMFRRLFEVNTVSRTPFHCDCGDLKRRHRIFRPGYELVVDYSTDRPRQLSQIIAEALWVELQDLDTPLCSVCGAAPSAQTEFRKFAYLPEVLMLPVTYGYYDEIEDDNYERWARRRTPRLTYPETLDMSSLRDDPDAHDADRNCLYKLQSVILSPWLNEAPPPANGVHFQAYLRRDETAWTLLDDYPPASYSSRDDGGVTLIDEFSPVTRQVSIDDIRNSSSTSRARLLMYVRIHPTEIGEEELDGLPDVEAPYSDNDTSGDDDPEDEAPGADGADVAALRVSPTAPEGVNSTVPGNAALTGSQPEVETQVGGGTPTPTPEDDAQPGGGRLGPLENDPNLYPITKTLPPGRLMDIIRAAGVRRRRIGREPRGSLGGIRRSAIAALVSIANTQRPQ